VFRGVAECLAAVGADLDTSVWPLDVGRSQFDWSVRMERVEWQTLCYLLQRVYLPAGV
jgi:hypothetical protein